MNAVLLYGGVRQFKRWSVDPVSSNHEDILDMSFRTNNWQEVLANKVQAYVSYVTGMVIGMGASILIA